ncbi:HAD family acid phosphatase [Sphingomonas sp. DT-207]|uniref:HAD family acid phosphatase n=1 Tax=Sphingomonas sp. DT-207 TaxID=3396167 RepID=UPI003F198C97
MIRVRGLRSVAAAAGTGALLSGCAAMVAAPVVAGAGIYKSSQDRSRARDRDTPASQAPQPGQVYTAPDGTKVQVTGLDALPPPSGVAPAPAVAAGGKVPPEMQYLYGSGEAAALSLQSYQALWNFLKVEIGYRRHKAEIRSVLLSPGSTLENPKFDLCGKRPLAVVLDVDETALLNLGFEADTAARGDAPYDPGRWGRFEQTGVDKVVAVPGAAEALAAARGEGITVVFNSNRSLASAVQARAAIEGAGLGPAVLGDTLWLKAEGETGKDARRWKIAERYCVVAMAGDQLGDFSDLFNAPQLSVRARRNSAGETMIAQLWGAGWFMLPNPVYGTGLKGGLDDVFPTDKRWTDPQEKK